MATDRPRAHQQLGLGIAFLVGAALALAVHAAWRSPVTDARLDSGSGSENDETREDPTIAQDEVEDQPPSTQGAIDRDTALELRVGDFWLPGD
jgi:hypothetical protein